jgi:hypothetical protein
MEVRWSGMTEAAVLLSISGWGERVRERQREMVVLSEKIAKMRVDILIPLNDELDSSHPNPISDSTSISPTLQAYSPSKAP